MTYSNFSLWVRYGEVVSDYIYPAITLNYNKKGVEHNFIS